MRQYLINYRLYFSDKTRSMIVYDKTKEGAYIRAFDELTDKNQIPFSIWVEGYINRNGDIHYFNTWEGRPY